jgi:acyl carrier protein
MTSRQEIVEHVREIAAEETGIPVAELTPDLDLRNVESVDSVKVLRVVARIERDYDVEVSDDQVFAFTTVSDVADAVLAALRTADPAP